MDVYMGLTAELLSWLRVLVVWMRSASAILYMFVEVMFSVEDIHVEVETFIPTINTLKMLTFQLLYCSHALKKTTII